jgi:hypothetical protein
MEIMDGGGCKQSGDLFLQFLSLNFLAKRLFPKKFIYKFK